MKCHQSVMSILKKMDYVHKKSRFKSLKGEMHFGQYCFRGFYIYGGPSNGVVNQWEDIHPSCFNFKNVVCSIMSHLDNSSGISSLFFLDYEHDFNFPLSNPQFLDIFYIIEWILDVCWSCMRTCMCYQLANFVGMNIGKWKCGAVILQQSIVTVIIIYCIIQEVISRKITSVLADL